jgi:F0F1-type ATP synthase epsilon subunit
LRPGIVTVHTGGASPRYVVGAGFAEAGPDRVTLLVDAAEDASTVNKDAAQKALDAAEAALAAAEPGSLAAEAASTARDLALVRLGA